MIYRFAERHGLAAGICTGDPVEPEHIISSLKVPFVNESMETRLNPAKILQGAKSVVVLGLGYHKKAVFDDDGIMRGRISLSAVGMDYHILLKGYMDKLVGELKAVAGFHYFIQVDNGPLMEREFAKKAGIGWQGKNCCIISPEMGSFLFLGVMVTSLALAPSMSYKNDDSQCGGCNRCIASCPGRALDGRYGCNPERCVSYLTQKKGMLTDKEMKSMGNAIYGCDICQAVCPYNFGTAVDNIEKPAAAAPDLAQFINQSNSSFKNTYGETSIFWRGRNVLRRNALIALGNTLDPAAIALVMPWMSSEDRTLKYTAQWAYDRIWKRNHAGER